MGMNVNLGTGVNSYSANALPSTAPKYTSQVQSSLLSQPAYDTVSFSGNYQTQEKKEGMSTGAKVGLVATAAAAVIGIWAASRGKKINTANGETTKLVNNLKTGIKSLFTKAGRESYNVIAKNSDKLDDLGKGIIDANGKAKSTREVTSDMLEAANKKGVAAQEEVNKLQTSLKELEASRAELVKNSGVNGEGVKDLDDQIKKLTDQITEQKKTASKSFKELAELKFDKNMADDIDYAELLKTQERCSTQLTDLTGKKSSLQKEINSIKTQRQQLADEIAKLKQTGGNSVDDLIKEKEALQTQLLDSFNKKNTELQDLSKKVTEAAESSKYATRDINAYTAAKKGYYYGEAQEGVNKSILKTYKEGLDSAVKTSQQQQEMMKMLQNNVNSSWSATSQGGQNRKTVWENVKKMIFGTK